MGTQRTRLLCNVPTAVKPPGLAPRESTAGRCGHPWEVGTGQAESEGPRNTCEAESRGPPRRSRGPPRRSRAWAEGAGTHQAGALETGVGARQEAGPLLVKLPLVLTAWGGGARMTGWSGESGVGGKA